jgi:hypothetical protein
MSLVAIVTMGLDASPATGQPVHPEGVFELSGIEATEFGCAGVDVPGLQTIYVFHTSFVGATRSRFRIQPGPGMTMTYVSEVHRFAQTEGNTQTGITICYDGLCLISSQLLATVTYMRYGTSEDCSKLLIVPHPEAETVEVMNCNLDPETAYVQDFSLDVRYCGCSPWRLIAGTPRSIVCTPPLPVEEATWGRIKAFYR